MLRFLLISGCGEGLGLALRLKDEGHEVAAWIRDKHVKGNFDGIVKRLEKWDSWLTPETIVLFDSSGGGKTADRLRAQGYATLCSSVFADDLEKDRDFGLEVMQSVGIRVPTSEKFVSWEKAKAYVKERDVRMAFKPSGKMGENTPSWCMGKSYDAEDMIAVMEWLEDLSNDKPEFELQDFVSGFEISTEGWFNGKDWILPFNHTIERKALMNDDIGPSGGCAGNIVWKAEGTNFIIDQGIKLVAPILRQQEFVGPIDLNTIVDDKGVVWGLEFSPRFGYDAMPTLLELFEMGTIGGFLADVAHGTTSWMKLKDGFAGGVRVSLNPYPSDKLKGPVGVPIRGLTKADRPHLYFYDVALDAKGRLISNEKICFCATGYSERSVDEAMNNAYEIVKRAKIPDAQYRTDLQGVTAGKFEQFVNLLKKHSKEKTQKEVHPKVSSQRPLAQIVPASDMTPLAR